MGAIFRTVAPAVVDANIILLEPNAIARTLPVFVRNIPTVRLAPFNVSVPALCVYVPAPPSENAVEIVTVPAV